MTRLLALSLLALTVAIAGCREDSPVNNDPVTSTAAKSPAPASDGEELHWMPWGPEIFRRARAENKLILLDSGATWCHWCHVMDRVTYEDAEVIKLLSETFIAVRIDRDRLPAIDAHYQRAVPIINSRGNGWPLTVVITPEGFVLYKATFLPPRADVRYGAQAGLIEVLTQLDRTWREHRDDILQAGVRVRDQINNQLKDAYVRPGRLDEGQVDTISHGLKHAFDERNGGFGGAPKFFGHAGTALLLRKAWSGDGRAGAVTVRTLEAQMRGGIYDHVGGGFHRYSVDERWHVPHFEKMSYDNAALLGTYANAYALTGQKDFARIVRHTLAWIQREMTTPGRKGFYASQDADVGLADDGDYFTWTTAEVKRAAGDHAKLAIAWYGVDDSGDMHERPGRNVLHVNKSLDEFARLHERPVDEARRALEQARNDLLVARSRRTAPGIDRTVFADLNGMMIDAHLTAADRVGDATARETALAVLDHLLETLRDDRGVFAHHRDGEALARVGLLADQAWMLRAILNAYTVTTDPKYIDAAEKVADYILSDLTAADGGFLNAPQTATTGPAGIAPARYWEDSPTRSGASVAAEAMITLGYLTGTDAYAQAGAKALESFAGGIDADYATFLAGWALSVDHQLNGPRTVVVVGPSDDEQTVALTVAARAAYLPGGFVLSLDPRRPHDSEMLKRLGYAAAKTPVAYVCRGKTCLAPAGTGEQLAQRLKELATQESDSSQ